MANRDFRYKHILALTVVGLFAAVNSGCLPSMVISSAAGGAAPVAFEGSGWGKAESYWIAKYDDVIAAALRAGKALSLEVKEKKVDGNKAFFRFQDTGRHRIDLTIERRTDTLTSIHFDIGWFGSIAFGRVMARQIIAELNDAGAFLEDWTPES